MILQEPTEEEWCLFAILTDETGIDLAEAEFVEPGHPSGRYRLRDYQWRLYNDPSQFQATRGARNVGKSYGIQARTAVHPFARPGEDYLLTAPQMVHLSPLITAVEERLKGTWITRQMLPSSAKSDGFRRAPHWEAHFVNGAKLISRLPGAGPEFKGAKGQHVAKIDVDEIQDYPDKAMEQLRECLNPVPGAQLRVHGVPTGVRGFFFNVTEGIDIGWSVHKPIAMMRPNWSETERREKLAFYKGKSQAYKCNLYGDHGESAIALFVLKRLIDCTDLELGSDYNSDIYTKCELDFDVLDGMPATEGLRLNGMHKSKWGKAPKGYSTYHGGMDVGITRDPSEICIWGQRSGTDRESLDLLLRVNLKQIPITEQERLVDRLFEWYGPALASFGVDATATGHGLGMALEEKYPNRVMPINFGEKAVVGMQDRDLKPGEKEEDLQIVRNIIDYASDCLRELVDAHSLLLPNDDDLIRDWQGQTVVITNRTATDPYGKRSYQGGKTHTLDAAKTMIAAKRLLPLHEVLFREPPQGSVLDLFVGA